ncbi:hypothetical protein RFI_07797 [Reticulomyxa filosa]|uniref:RRM domain-containing protein n=1 Tax=Reticulomyxa filosa TaxID=46433 RepID=X6NTM2_RETFI|nr:hypothetical protein RFI_07797 [Reticulomyxa filosa]|eukprot:ETO29326.1 hypothetical protein RFI_07797 [Reticulomyxa filosa]
MQKSIQRTNTLVQIDNLSYWSDEERLRERLSKTGEIVGIVYSLDNPTSAMIQFKEEASAIKCVEQMENVSLDGSRLKVRLVHNQNVDAWDGLNNKDAIPKLQMNINDSLEQIVTYKDFDQHCYFCFLQIAINYKPQNHNKKDAPNRVVTEVHSGEGIMTYALTNNFQEVQCLEQDPALSKQCSHNLRVLNRINRIKFFPYYNLIRSLKEDLIYIHPTLKHDQSTVGSFSLQQYYEKIIEWKKPPENGLKIIAILIKKAPSLVSDDNLVIPLNIMEFVNSLKHPCLCISIDYNNHHSLMVLDFVHNFQEMLILITKIQQKKCILSFNNINIIRQVAPNDSHHQRYMKTHPSLSYSTNVKLEEKNDESEDSYQSQNHGYANCNSNEGNEIEKKEINVDMHEPEVTNLNIQSSNCLKYDTIPVTSTSGKKRTQSQFQNENL